MRSFLGISAAGLLVVACSHAGTPQRNVATLSLKSAIVEVPDVTVTCRGGPVCKELVAPREQKDAIEEAKEDCTSRGGLVGTEPCPRANVVGHCDLGGGAGPIRIFSYDQAAAKHVSDLCNTMDGELDVQ